MCGDVMHLVVTPLVSRVFSLMMVLLIYKRSTAQDISGDKPKEYCSADTFTAECPSGQVIHMVTARYGRMRSGRCITSEYKHAMNCHTEVLTFMDQHCAGQQRCEVVVGSLDQVAEPCHKDFKSFLEASFECVEVYSGMGCRDGVEQISLTAGVGFLSSHLLHDHQQTGHLRNCMWSIHAQPGRRIKITLWKAQPNNKDSFGTELGDPSMGLSSECSWEIVFGEGHVEKRTSLCYNGEREKVVYESTSPMINMFFEDTGRYSLTPNFLLKYQGVGCVDVPIPNGGWIKRTGDSVLEIHCNHTGETSYMTCKQDQWMGNMANCTSDLGIKNRQEMEEDNSFLQEGIVFAVILGVMIGLLIGTSMLATVLFCRRKRRKPYGSRGSIERRNGGNELSYRCTEELHPALHPGYSTCLDHDEKITTLRLEGGNVGSGGIGTIYSDYSHVWEMTPRQSHQQVQPSQLDLIESTERCPLKQSGTSSQGCLLDYHHDEGCPNNQQTYSSAPSHASNTNQHVQAPSALTVIDSSGGNTNNTSCSVDVTTKAKCAFL